VAALLEDPATTFLIVTAPRHDPVEEAIYFHRKLRDAGMPFGGLVVNRLHAAAPSVNGAAALEERIGPALTGRVETSAREQAALAARDEANLARLLTELGDPPAVVVPEFEDDVHDVEGLALMRAHLLGEG
jgi:hypothetical protein